MRNRLLFTLTATFLFVASNSNAATIAGFGAPIDHAALSGGTVIDFSSVQTGEFDSLTIDGVTFSGEIPNWDVEPPVFVDSIVPGQYNTTGQALFNRGDDYDQPTWADLLLFSFDSPVSAFAFNFGASDDFSVLSAYDVNGDLIESMTIDPLLDANNGEYFGLSGAGISFVTLTMTSEDWVFVDNFTYTTVPIPASLPLLLGGLSAFYGLRRRKQSP